MMMTTTTKAMIMTTANDKDYNDAIYPDKRLLLFYVPLTHRSPWQRSYSLCTCHGCSWRMCTDSWTHPGDGQQSPCLKHITVFVKLVTELQKIQQENANGTDKNGI